MLILLNSVFLTKQIYTDVHVYIYMYICIHIHIYVYVSMHVYMYTYEYKQTQDEKKEEKQKIHRKNSGIIRYKCLYKRKWINDDRG